MKYTLRRWWRQLLRSIGRSPQGAHAGPVVRAFLEGASARECAYRYWYRGASAELATAQDWPAAVLQVEATIREYAEQLAEELEQLQKG